eukprot:1004430-Prymnesium_polylepis.1
MSHGIHHSPGLTIRAYCDATMWTKATEHQLAGDCIRKRGFLDCLSHRQDPRAIIAQCGRRPQL